MTISVGDTLPDATFVALGGSSELEACTALELSSSSHESGVSNPSRFITRLSGPCRAESLETSARASSSNKRAALSSTCCRNDIARSRNAVASAAAAAIETLVEPSFSPSSLAGSTAESAGRGASHTAACTAAMTRKPSYATTCASACFCEAKLCSLKISGISSPSSTVSPPLRSANNAPMLSNIAGNARACSVSLSNVRTRAFSASALIRACFSASIAEAPPRRACCCFSRCSSASR